MRERPAVSKEGPFIEIGHSSLKILLGNGGLELPLERAAGGRLSDVSRRTVREKLTAFLESNGVSRRESLCALSASGASLRHFRLPRTTREETLRTLELQVETEFPLSPDQLCWAYEAFPSGDGVAPKRRREKTTFGALRLGRLLPGNGAPANGEATQEITVVGLRREVIVEYEKLLVDCGLQPSFRLGALASHRLCEERQGRHGLLDIGRSHSELLLFEGEKPLSIRVLPWGGEDITRAISERLTVDLDEAERRKRGWEGSLDPELTTPLPNTEEARTHRAIQGSIARLVSLIRQALPEILETPGPDPAVAGGAQARRSGDPENQKVARLFLSGAGSRLPGLPERLGRDLGGIPCARLDVADGPGVSAVTLGLRRQAMDPASDGVLTFLPFKKAADKAEFRPRKPALARWLTAALLLAVASLGLRYGHPLLLIPGLREEVSQKEELLRSHRSVDGELGFLKHVRKATGEIPHLDLLTAIARVAPAETRLTSITINRVGELSLDGTVASQEQANELRRGLLLCGLFSRVVLREHGPAGKVVRFRLQARAILGVSLKEFDEDATASREAPEAGANAPAGKPSETTEPSSTPSGPEDPEVKAKDSPKEPLPKGKKKASEKEKKKAEETKDVPLAPVPSNTGDVTGEPGARDAGTFLELMMDDLSEGFSIEEVGVDTEIENDGTTIIIITDDEAVNSESSGASPPEEN